MTITQEQVIEQLKLVSDPEVIDREGKPVDIWEMGLIYNIDIANEDPSIINIRMTLTSQGCPMGQVIQRDVVTRVTSIPGVGKANIEIVWQPPWGPAMLSENAKKRLGMGEDE